MDVGIDTLASVAASTVQFGSPQPSVILPVAAANLLYSAGIRDWIASQYGGVDGTLEDSFTRDIVAKTGLTTLLSFFTNQFLSGQVDILGATVNSAITFSAAGGIRQILDLS